MTAQIQPPDKRPVLAARSAPGRPVNDKVAERSADEIQVAEVPTCRGAHGIGCRPPGWRNRDPGIVGWQSSAHCGRSELDRCVDSDQPDLAGGIAGEYHVRQEGKQHHTSHPTSKCGAASVIQRHSVPVPRRPVELADRCESSCRDPRRFRLRCSHRAASRYRTRQPIRCQCPRRGHAS